MLVLTCVTTPHVSRACYRSDGENAYWRMRSQTSPARKLGAEKCTNGQPDREPTSHDSLLGRNIMTKHRFHHWMDGAGWNKICRIQGMIFSTYGREIVSRLYDAATVPRRWMASTRHPTSTGVGRQRRASSKEIGNLAVQRVGVSGGTARRSTQPHAWAMNITATVVEGSKTLLLTKQACSPKDLVCHATCFPCFEEGLNLHQSETASIYTVPFLFAVFLILWLAISIQVIRERWAWKKVLFLLCWLRLIGVQRILVYLHSWLPFLCHFLESFPFSLLLKICFLFSCSTSFVFPEKYSCGYLGRCSTTRRIYPPNMPSFLPMIVFSVFFLALHKAIFDIAFMCLGLFGSRSSRVCWIGSELYRVVLVLDKS